MKKKKSNYRNAGRKPVADKAVTICCFPKQSQVDAVGGIESAKEIALKAIEEKASTYIFKTQ